VVPLYPLPLLLLLLLLLLLYHHHAHHPQVLGLGITNQRETSLVWSRSTGQPLHNAIVWLDNRTKWVWV